MCEKMPKGEHDVLIEKRTNVKAAKKRERQLVQNVQYVRVQKDEPDRSETSKKPHVTCEDVLQMKNIWQ